MAVQTMKSGYLLTVPATEDELILTGPFPTNGNVKFVNVSGTTKFGIGGPVFSDTNYVGVTGAGTVVEMRVDTSAQSDSSQRIHVSGVGTWRVMY